jgi:hypothetical protein
MGSAPALAASEKRASAAAYSPAAKRERAASRLGEACGADVGPLAGCARSGEEKSRRARKPKVYRCFIG